MGTFFDSSLWKQLFKMYYNVDISNQFINCADSQLSAQFEEKTGLKATWPVHLHWSGPLDGGVFNYEKGIVSKLSTEILLIYGKAKVEIVWQSKSSRIYNLADTDIDCKDIKFWFEGLDVKLCRHLVFPNWTLFTFPEMAIKNFKEVYGVEISGSFIACADSQLSPLFEKQTGIKINKLISMGWPLKNEANLLNFQTGKISKLRTRLYINPYLPNFNFPTICWKSRSGRIYETSDTDIDCADTEFWFEGLDAKLCYEQLYPNDKLPLKLKDLTYELVINRINTDCTLTIELKPEVVAETDGIIENLGDFVNNFNVKSEKKDRQYGVVHNSKAAVEKEGTINFELDLGSAGAPFLKKLLAFMSKMDCFVKVEVD